MCSPRQHEPHAIGRLNEQALHAALKRWYARPGDALEVSIGGFVVDIVRGDLLIEIQTRGFSAIRRKLAELTLDHPVRLVYPIAREKWIVKLAADGHTRLSRRKSPKRGGLALLFEELVSLPRLMAHPNFSLDVLLIQEEEVRREAPARRRRRRGWVSVERRLLDVVEQRLFERPSDLAALLPRDLPEPFTTAELAAAIAAPRRLAQRMAYCLREMRALAQTGKRGNAILYARRELHVKRGVTILGVL